MSLKLSRYLFLTLIFYAYCADAANTPQPLVCSTSTEYLGYDGQWSPVTIRVGTPEQWISVMPSTLSQETWLMGAGACDGTVACSTARGGLFYSNESSTFHDMGFYELGYDPDLGDSQYGYYGLDTIALSDSASEQDQIVALLNTTNVWVGELGLGVQQTRLNGSDNRLPLLSSLVQNNSVIPSHSYGYTAGAAYRLKGVPASLTLGGVDANRFTPNNLSFTLNSNYAPLVAINSISVSSSADDLPSNWNVNPMNLMDDSEASVFTIDSSTPYLWLPGPVCDKFAAALNLTYNETLDLYIFANDSTSPDILQSWNLTFSFEIGNLPGSSENVKLTLPYSAFNVDLSYGFPGFDGNYTSPPLPYFPVRRATDDTQYILGRAFLQETYLMVDYERNSFSLSQAVITEEAINNVNLLAITRPSDSIFPGPNSDGSGGLSTGAKAGIGVGVGLAVVLIGVLIWFLVRRRRRSAGETKLTDKPKRRTLFSRSPKPPGSATTVSELLGDKTHPTEVPADSTTSRFELPGSAPLEMPAGDVSPTFYENPESRDSSAQRNEPVELQQRQQQSKEAEAAAGAAASERSASPVPPYSPAEMNQRLSNSISPYSPRHSQAFGTVSSGEQGISPVGHSSGGSSQRNSNSVPSPVSPEATAPRGFQRYTQASEPGSSESSYGQHLTPQIPGRVPSRSPSRGSRFVEEGLNGGQEEHNSSSRSARFSWEE